MISAEIMVNRSSLCFLSFIPYPAIMQKNPPTNASIQQMRCLMVSLIIFHHQPSNRVGFSFSGFVVSARVESFFHAGVECGGGGCSISL